MPPTPLCLIQVIVVAASAPPGCIAALWLPFSPSLFFPSATSLSSTPGLLTPTLLEPEPRRPPEPDHILQCVISISRYQLSNDANNPSSDNDTAHTLMSTHTPPQGLFACTFPHLLRLHHCVLAALALLPPISSTPTYHMLRVESGV